MPEIIKSMPTRAQELAKLIEQDWHDIEVKIEKHVQSAPAKCGIIGSIIDLVKHSTALMRAP